MEVHLKIIGILFMILALGHVFMPKYFNWKTDFSNLSLFNRQMIKVHTFFIALTVFGIGLLSFVEATSIIQTALGQKIALAFGVFWLFRLVAQLFVYSTKLWIGKRFETTMHILFTALWIYTSFIYLTIGLTNF